MSRKPKLRIVRNEADLDQLGEGDKIGRKPELRIIKGEADLDQLVEGDKIVIDDTGAIPSMYVAAYSGRSMVKINNENLFEFVSPLKKGKSILLETVDKLAVNYNGDGSVSFKRNSGHHFQEERELSFKKKYHQYVGVLGKAGFY